MWTNGNTYLLEPITSIFRVTNVIANVTLNTTIKAIVNNTH